jgi:hypothetical protein
VFRLLRLGRAPCIDVCVCVCIANIGVPLATPRARPACVPRIQYIHIRPQAAVFVEIDLATTLLFTMELLLNIFVHSQVSRDTCLLLGVTVCVFTILYY